MKRMSKLDILIGRLSLFNKYHKEKLKINDVSVKFLWAKIKENIPNNSRMSSQKYKSLLK